MKSKLTLHSRLLAIIGRRFPSVYDVIPRGPQDRFSSVALNPQPLPPYELGAAVAAELIHAGWLAEHFGHDVEQVFHDIDDWCPTVPKRLKLPPWWPPIPDPEPHPDWFTDFHIGFAARLANASMEDGVLSRSLDRLIERSMSAIESVADNQFDGQRNTEEMSNYRVG